MSRLIPTQVQVSIDSPASTLTRLLRVIMNNGQSYGLCMSNMDVTYDHGDESITYVATNGFDPSAFSSDLAYSVDNAEGYALISNDVPGVTKEMVDAGLLDGAQWICYYVDYLNPSIGSAAILDAGDLGQVRTQFGMLWIPELLSYIMRLKQTIGDVWSRTCRADFGTPAASPHGCGIDADALWQDFTVTAVGAETDRTFFTTGITQDPNKPLYPGRVLWVTGNNAGKKVATESFTAETGGEEITMLETVAYPIQVGDTGRIRPDCDKTWDQCGRYDNKLNIKAEPLIPVGDTAAIQIPGAQT